MECTKNDQSLRLSAIFSTGGAKSLKRPAMLVSGVHKKCSEPEAVGNFHHGGAKSLRRPAIFVSGVRKMRTQPETVGKFAMGVQKA